MEKNDGMDWIRSIPSGIDKKIFIEILKNHPWFELTVSGSNVVVEISDQFIKDFGNIKGWGLMDIDFSKKYIDIVNDIRKEFHWSYEGALDFQGRDGLNRLIIVMDELAKLLEPYVGKENVKYYSNYLNESFDWVGNLNNPITVCEGIEVLKPGDHVLINYLPHWQESNFYDSGVENVSADIIAIDRCDEIQPKNQSNEKVILIHVNDDYSGFDEWWVEGFKNKYRKLCDDGKCMFLFCGEDDKEIRLSKFSTDFLKESFEWVNDFNHKEWVLNDLKVGDKFDGFNDIITITNLKQKNKIMIDNGKTIEIPYYKVEFIHSNGELNSTTSERFLDLLNKNVIIKIGKRGINEVGGISLEPRKWVKIIMDRIKNVNNGRVIIDGYDYENEFNVFPIDYIVIDFNEKFDGYIDENSGFDSDGNYVVHLYLKPNKNENYLITTLNHEMKHAWEDYNRISKGKTPIGKTKESKVLYNKDFINMLSDKNVKGPIKELLEYYYYLSKLETGAFLENVYDNYLRYEDKIRDIFTKDFNDFKQKHDLIYNWNYLTTNYNIPFLNKFKNPVEFINFSNKELKYRSFNMIKKINKMKFLNKK